MDQDKRVKLIVQAIKATPLEKIEVNFLKEDLGREYSDEESTLFRNAVAKVAIFISNAAKVHGFQVDFFNGDMNMAIEKMGWENEHGILGDIIEDYVTTDAGGAEFKS